MTLLAPPRPSRTVRRGWRGPRYDGEVPTLGYGVLEWMTSYLPSPRDSSQPFVPTDDQAQGILLWYAIHPHTGDFIYRRWLKMRAKGIGKSPIVGAILLAGLGASHPGDSAPVMFDGWDAEGEPVGRPWGTGGLPPAWVQIAAVSEDQTDNTYSALYQMLTANQHRAAIALGIDDGRTRLYLKGRPGKLEPVTHADASREGQPVTDAGLDETHLWTPRNGGQRLARTIRRNVAKMNGRTIETANAPTLGEGSVAERSLKAAEAGSPGIYVDAKRPAIDPDPSWEDERLLGALREAYGDAWWVDLPRLLADIRDPDMPWEDALRFFFNIPTAGGGKAVDPRRWDALAKPREVEAGTRIGAGYDGSISRDATMLRGCTADGYSFLIGKWERPSGGALQQWLTEHPGESDWRVVRSEVNEAVARMFATWDVGLFLCDPPRWQTEIENWAELYGEETVLALDTNQPTRMAPAVGRWLTALEEGTHTHDDDPTTNEHVKAAQKAKVRVSAADDDGRTKYVLVKSDTRHIDGAIADVLAYEAAMTMPPKEEPPEPWVILGVAR